MLALTWHAFMVVIGCLVCLFYLRGRILQLIWSMNRWKAIEQPNHRGHRTAACRCIAGTHTPVLRKSVSYVTNNLCLTSPRTGIGPDHLLLSQAMAISLADLASVLMSYLSTNNMDSTSRDRIISKDRRSWNQISTPGVPLVILNTWTAQRVLSKALTPSFRPQLRSQV